MQKKIIFFFLSDRGGHVLLVPARVRGLGGRYSAKKYD